MSNRSPPVHIAAPRVWPTWCLVGIGWLIARLPWAAIFRLSKRLGRVAFRLGGTRRHITETNLRLCFPELDSDERNAMARRVFEAVTLGALELCVAWLNPKRGRCHSVRVEGAKHFHGALAEGRGLVLLGAHFAVMDIIAAPLANLGPVDVMYRRNRNPVWEWLQVRGRSHYFKGVLERKALRPTLLALKAGHAIWYAADQDYGPKHSVFAPFFGVSAATITATAQLARHNGSPVLMMSQHRDPEERSWTIRFEPPLANFPSGDAPSDAAAVNQAIEKAVRRAPEQYLWLHRRFKTRPPGKPGFYGQRQQLQRTNRT
ncbi:MAG: LpxL/LpxP family Kdo(2)-lipid IV(A) lauroyl/palmitoleoyl acyltransferase [Gammaproteobacteria bacterium]|nr:LpxL/LpxP family Kdo(2)-lipid IV(A) lauroyl/palmitoleoyl acyltransferase [Gammaproteobacteria bacterium]MDD9961379.1 LpxL/LpxP family Kdo(2)-lipid IV(A) lauroyl/palmitoleoyl acyltransferase [Gammaproteobacteria bacterium]MDE0272766.1 LpxL/LpxP family Kdo(2)-lipid IV(A) lauroyl/palmitoleoyl acyltransferase [Gammaproteobacteria bacterium]